MPETTNGAAADLPPISRAYIQEVSAALRERREARSQEDIFSQYPPEVVAAYKEECAQLDEQFARDRQQKEEEKRQQDIKRAIKDSGIPDRYRHCRFSSLDRTFNPEGYDICKSYVDADLKWEGQSGLLLKGPPGTGKTSLAVASLLYRMEEKWPWGCKFVPLSLLLQKARESFGNNGQSWSINDLTNGTLVAIDDLGRQRPTEWTAEMLYTIIGQLYDENKHVIITTNATKQQWDDYLDEAIRSRITEMCFPVTMAGDDLRTKVRQ